MYNIFQKYLDDKIVLSREQSDWIRSLSVVKKLRKHQYLLQEGDVCKHHAFVTKGCLRSYSVDSHGMEHIVKFAVENWWIADRDSLKTGEPAKLNIDAVEDSEAVLLTGQDFDLVCQQVPAFNDMVNNLLQSAYNASQNRVLANISLYANEKYEYFLQRYPDLALRLPQSMIASYLGISPETLSRVRNQAMSK
jgi:CRP/FNR family transcriptional regulator, anaerobic regulatory protein